MVLYSLSCQRTATQDFLRSLGVLLLADDEDEILDSRSKTHEDTDDVYGSDTILYNREHRRLITSKTLLHQLVTTIILQWTTLLLLLST